MSKITQLTEATNPSSGDDLVEIVIDTGTTPLSRKMKFLNLLKRVFLGDGTQLTITTIADGEFLKRSGTNILGASPGGSGLGDVVGPASTTDNAITRYDTTTGKLIQNSAVLIDDNGGVTVPEIAAPSTPASGKVAVYAKADGKLYIKDDTGAETDLTATGTGTIAGSTGATDNAVLRADGTGGSTLQSSAISVDDNGAVTVPEIAAPSTPASGKVVLYAKADGLLYSKDDAGTESAVSGGGGATINPTDNVLPRRSNSTTFADSLLTHEAANSKTHTTGHFSIDQNTNRVLGFANSGSAIAFGGLAAAGVGAMKVVADAAGNPGTILAGFATPPAPGGIPTPWSSNGMNYRQVLTGNVTIGNPGQSGGNGTAIDGYRFIFMLVQDGTGSRTATWSSDFKFPSGTAPTLTTTANAVDIFEFICFNDIAYCIGQHLDVK